MGRRIKPLSQTSRKRVRNFFDSITDEEINTQIDYWSTRTPVTDNEIKNRWLFAYTSVHTTWQSNVAQYNLLKDSPLNNLSAITYKLILSRGGMQNLKADGIFNFGIQWQQDSSAFTNQPTCLRKFRDTLCNKLTQINFAKVSFALEMCKPLTANVVCLDRHILALFGHDKETAPGKTLYHKMEDYWLRLSKLRDVPPYIARCVYWDRAQNQSDSHYWAYIL